MLGTRYRIGSSKSSSLAEKDYEFTYTCPPEVLCVNR